MATHSDRTGLNAGYVGLLLEQYHENPEAVDPAWRELFERADDSDLSGRGSDDGNGAAAVSAVALSTVSPVLQVEAPAAAVSPVEASPSEALPVEAPTASSKPEEPSQQAVASVATDLVLLQAVASAMALVDAIRSHGHLAARLDPLGSEPLGD
ncbi:MAG: hypothetical protein WD380_03270, partial [Gaiellaceae bacterium]